MRCFLCFAILIGTLGVSSCKRSESSIRRAIEPPARTFTVQGILRAIDFAGKSVTVEHEDIPDFMPAMAMPFDVKNMAEVELLKAGDAIEFKLVVAEKSSWIEGVKRIDPREIQLPAKEPVAAAQNGNVARLKEGDRLPDYQLTDSKGREITRETFAGKPLLLTFIFTRCPIPNFCPLMTTNFREVQQALMASPDQANSVQLLSISFDPQFDTPQVLSEYAASQTKNTDQWRFATGTSHETGRLTQAFAIAVNQESGTINHGLATALVDGHGVIRNIWRGNAWKPDEVIAALRDLGIEFTKP
jgi:protein SCO1/2